MDYRKRSVLDKLKLSCVFNCQLEVFGHVQFWSSEGEDLSWKFKLQSHSLCVIVKANKSTKKVSVGGAEVQGLTGPTSI